MRKSDDELKEVISCANRAIPLLNPDSIEDAEILIDLCTELLALRKVERAARKLMSCSIFFKGFDKELLELMGALKELDNCNTQ